MDNLTSPLPLPSASDAADTGHTIAVVHTWPDIRNAEYEIVHRVVRAARNLGVHVSVIDNDGFRLWSSRNDLSRDEGRISQDSCDFVISLHFESPRLYDVFSYTALWNPPEFYEGFNYQRAVEQLASHSDLLSCRSDLADAHAANVYAGLGRHPAPPYPTLFHTIPGPYPAPRISETSRLFYVGINWERVNGEKGRHQELLEQLDAEDLISIYGPKLFLGVEPWAEFKTYRGEIPFDGSSLVQRINEAGICLAYSSAAHQQSGIMSNRLFEGLAAGAVIIANPHPLIDRYFADCVHVVDDTDSPEETAARIRALVLDIRRDVPAALERARRGQDRFREGFTLERCLGDLIAAHPQRKEAARLREHGAGRHEVTVILNYTGREIAALAPMFDNLRRQKDVTIRARLVCDADLHTAFRDRIEDAADGIALDDVITARFYPDADGFDRPVKRRQSSGGLVNRALAGIETEFFCVMEADDHWFAGHLATLCQALTAMPDAGVAVSGRLLEWRAAERRTTLRRLDELAFKAVASLIEARHPRDAGRFLYRRRMLADLPGALLDLLDGFEHRALAVRALLDGPLAQTGQASYVQDLTKFELLPASILSDAAQTNFILDSVRGDPRYLALGLRLPGAGGGTAPEDCPVLEFDHRYRIARGGDGLSLIQSGFSKPEPQFTWIDGRLGNLAFELPNTDAPLELVMVAFARRGGGDGAAQICTILFDDEPIASIEIGEQSNEYRVSLPDGLRGRIAVRLRLRHAARVFDSGVGRRDSRLLGFCLAEFGIMRLAQAVRPLRLDHRYELAEGGDGVALLGKGFATPEGGFTWIDGRSAAIELPLAPGNEAREIVLVAAGKPSAAGERQVATVTLNGKAIGDHPVDSQPTTLRFPLPRDLQGRATLGLALHHAEPVADASGAIVDRRKLGLQVHSIAVARPGRMTDTPRTTTGLVTLRRLARAARRRLR